VVAIGADARSTAPSAVPTGIIEVALGGALVRVLIGVE
jgi:hypothetical protein